jgi:hypothetical protein
MTPPKPAAWLSINMNGVNSEIQEEKKHADMERVVIDLCWSSLFLNDSIGFTIFGNRFA